MMLQQGRLDILIADKIFCKKFHNTAWRYLNGHFINVEISEKNTP